MRSHYDNLRYYSPLDRDSLSTICRAVGVEVPSRLLDLGCGDGRIAKRNPHLDVTSVDYNQRRAEAAGGIHSDLYAFMEEAQERWPLAVFIEVLEHLEDPLYAIELARAVADQVVATVPINLPYEAHLQVWRTGKDAAVDLGADEWALMGPHVALRWKGTHG